MKHTINIIRDVAIAAIREEWHYWTASAITEIDGSYFAGANIAVRFDNSETEVYKLIVTKIVED